jgi:hypothetical protein
MNKKEYPTPPNGHSWASIVDEFQKTFERYSVPEWQQVDYKLRYPVLSPVYITRKPRNAPAGNEVLEIIVVTYFDALRLAHKESTAPVDSEELGISKYQSWLQLYYNEFDQRGADRVTHIDHHKGKARTYTRNQVARQIVDEIVMHITKTPILNLFYIYKVFGKCDPVEFDFDFRGVESLQEFYKRFLHIHTGK